VAFFIGIIAIIIISSNIVSTIGVGIIVNINIIVTATARPTTGAETGSSRRR
jgi:hypothetical protein